MDYTSEEYTKYYIVQALFKLMSQYAFDEISVTDIARKAGVGRATFYRHFKSKEDIIRYYFERNTKDFVLSQKFYPRCKDDYIAIARSAFEMFARNIEPFKLIRKARLEYIYLDYLNKMFASTFNNEYSQIGSYAPYLYAGMLFNVSMAWLDNNCRESVDELAAIVVNAIYFDGAN